MESYSSYKDLHYVLAYDNDCSVKDVTARYASKWLTITRKLRISYIDPEWWKDTLSPYKTQNQKMDEEENRQLESCLLSQDMPTSIAAFKNHPLFALRRHLLKYEAIYPKDVPSVGFVRGEEIFPRSAIHTLHSQGKWLQFAREVREGEVPYKMVASFLKNKKNNVPTDTPSLALFGEWQTIDYQVPSAENGKVPRNEYGNVNLFKPSMLPKGCVHLRLNGLSKVANKLKIDSAVAIVGFGNGGGGCMGSHPEADGYIVCQEHEEILRAAWDEEQVNIAKREEEKRLKAIYGRWKTLIQGALCAARVKRKYVNTDGMVSSGSNWQAEALKQTTAKPEKKTGRRRKKKVNENLPFENVETL